MVRHSARPCITAFLKVKDIQRDLLVDGSNGARLLFRNFPMNVGSSLTFLCIADFPPSIGMSSRIQQLVRNLQELKTVGYDSPDVSRKSNAAAERALNLIFEIGKRGLHFTDEEKRTIGALVAEVILPIQINIEREGCVFRTRLDNSILRKRSALQFLVDSYKNFPTGTANATLSGELSRANIRETVQILDDIIAKWHDMSDSDEVQSDRETTGLPSSHSWWTA